MRLAVFGAPTDTSNLGLTALFYSLVEVLLRHIQGAELVNFQNSVSGEIQMGRGDGIRVQQIAMPNTRDPRKANGVWIMRANSFLGSAIRTPGLEVLRSSSAVLDIGGGDSFSDIYGMRRLRSVSAPKRLAARLGIPLVMLPQTVGPFTRRAALRLARRDLESARVVWTRDAPSVDLVASLVGTTGPEVHQGIDLAFALPIQAPGEIQSNLRDWYDTGGNWTTVGLNPSGLLAVDRSRRSLGVLTEHEDLCSTVIERLLRTAENVRVLLVNHVDGDYEFSDHHVARRLSTRFQGSDRVVVLDRVRDPREAKWHIARCDAFIGARMHATIAALSAGVPTLGLAYSDKMRGVYDTVGEGVDLVDLRRAGAAETAERACQLLIESEDRRPRAIQIGDRIRARAEAQGALLAKTILEACG